jgi:membrane protease YdiL (CAAX protease family)
VNDKSANLLLGWTVLFEVLYLICRTVMTHDEMFRQWGAIQQEFARTGLRSAEIVLVLIACWRSKMFPLFFIKPKLTRQVVYALVALAIVFLLWPKFHRTEWDVKIVFAVTSIFVAVREELVYRYVIQNWLEGWLPPKDRIAGSILITSIVFTLSHIGVQPFAVFPLILAAGIVLGWMYISSGKCLLLIISCHFIFDALLELQ